MIWNGFPIYIFLLLYGLPGTQFLLQIFEIIVGLYLLITRKAVEHERSYLPTLSLAP